MYKQNSMFDFHYLFLLFVPVSGSFHCITYQDAVAWLPQQTIQGDVRQLNTQTITVHQDSKTFTITVNKDNTFSFSLSLHDGDNRIWVSAKSGGKTVSSDTVTMRLGYHPTPVIKPYGVVNGNTVVLHAATLSTPWKTLNYHWTGDARNPANVTIAGAADSTARAIIPAKVGVYYFNLLVTSGNDTTRFQTYITRTATKLQAFDMDSAYAPWIQDAVIYEITPYAFVKNATYDDIIAKLPEIKAPA